MTRLHSTARYQHVAGARHIAAVFVVVSSSQRSVPQLTGSNERTPNMRPRDHGSSLSLGQLPYVCVPDVCVPVSPAYVSNAKLRTNTKSCPPSASCPSTHGTRITGPFMHELDDGGLIGKRRGLRSSENVQAAKMPLPIEAVLLQAIIGEQTCLCRSATAEGGPPPLQVCKRGDARVAAYDKLGGKVDVDITHRHDSAGIVQAKKILYPIRRAHLYSPPCSHRRCCAIVTPKFPSANDASPKRASLGPERAADVSPNRSHLSRICSVRRRQEFYHMCTDL
jgi:hypothetical protein